MKVIVFSRTWVLSTALAFSACNATETKPSPTNSAIVTANKKQATDLDVASLLEKSGLKKLKMNKDAYTWQDVEAIYKQLDVSSYNAKEMAFLKSTCAELALTTFGLLQDNANQDTRDSYIEIIRTHKLASNATYVQIIKAVRQKWNADKVEALKAELVADATAYKNKVEKELQDLHLKAKDGNIERGRMVVIKVGIKIHQNWLHDFEVLINA